MVTVIRDFWKETLPQMTLLYTKAFMHNALKGQNDECTHNRKGPTIESSQGFKASRVVYAAT